MIAQSFDEAVVSQLRELVLSPAAAQLSASNLHELSLSLYESPAFRIFKSRCRDLKRDVLGAISDWSKIIPEIRRCR